MRYISFYDLGIRNIIVRRIITKAVIIKEIK